MNGSAHVLELLREYFQQYGYWTVAFMLLLENAGLPVPGETTLLFASFLAYSEHRLQMPVVIAVGIAAAMTGDNAGYAIGYFGGRRLVNRYLHVLHINDAAVRRGESFFARHGALAVFGGRFIAGIRVLTGPLAGTLCMPWGKFFVFNFLGATAWVLLIASLGYFFGGQWGRLHHILGRANLAVVLALFIVFAIWWWKRMRARAAEAKADPE